MRFREAWGRTLAVASFGAFVASAACGGSSAGSGGPAADACGDLYDAEVAYDTSCDSAGGALFESRDRAVQSCALRVNAPGVAPGLASALQACASAAKNDATACNRTDFDCSVPAGTRAYGSACGEDEQCASGYCKMVGLPASPEEATTLSAICGYCAAVVAVGQGCATTDRCAQGAACQASATGDAVCTVLPVNDVGGSCLPPATCKAGLRCAPNATCAATLQAGAPCTSVDDCTSPLVCVGNVCAEGKKLGDACQNDCARNLVCATQCVAITPVAAGQPCDFTHRCKAGVCNVTDPATGTGTCPTILPDGQACASAAGATCDTGAYCIDGKCAVFDPASCK
jgi:hypothetical protein